MREQDSRTAMLLGEDGVDLLRSAHVAVFGVGGVGGYTVEALARAGVGKLTLVDADTVSVSNINRQIIALHSTVGKYKTEAARDRVLDINPEAVVVCKNLYFSEECADEFNFRDYDFVVDAIDSLSSKIELICRATEAGVPVISAMGAGNKLDPTRFEVADISKTEVCPLARAVRIALRKRGINHLRVVYSRELPAITGDATDDRTPVADGKHRVGPKRAPGSLSFVPSAMGLIIAGEVICELSGIRKSDI